MSNQDTWTDHEDARQIALLKSQIEDYRDFIGFLFDEEVNVHCMTESEAWECFRKWQNKQN